MGNLKRIKFVLLFAVPILSFFSCKKDEISTDPAHKLSFSQDTLSFDTLLSERLSATLRMKVYNNNKESVKISKAYLLEGSASIFRINVNGQAGVNLSNIEVRGEDSLWVFVDVNVPSGTSNLPFEVNEKLRFVTNGNAQDVILNAWGQNAVRHEPSSGDTLILGHSEVWDGSIPHVIYGALKVDSNSTLTIESGCHVYFHEGASLVIAAGSTFIVEGDLGDEVVFQGDRLEEKYKEVSGQWQGVVLQEGSGDHVISDLVIKGASTGLAAYGRSASMGTFVTASNLLIKYCLNYGYYGEKASGIFFNTSIHDCGADAFRVAAGGDYQLYHTTLYANASSSAQGNSNHALTLQNWSFVDGTVNTSNLERFEMYNSIIYGTGADALSLSDEGAQFNYLFDYCLLLDQDSNGSEFTNCIFNENPDFREGEGIEVLLGEQSSAIDHGKIDWITTYPGELGTDLKGENRGADGKPDLGAYEFNPDWIN